MKTSTLNRFRVIKLIPDEQRDHELPPIICADPIGGPFIVGNEFYKWLVDDNACLPVTAANYLNLVLKFFSFLDQYHPSIKYNASPEKIRIIFREYLHDKLDCVVRQHRYGNYLVITSKNSPRSVRLAITALKRFYQFAEMRNFYKYSNPMIWSNRMMKEFIPKMPPISGMTLPESRGREPESYFCVVNSEWNPKIIDDPDIPTKLCPNFSNLRDYVIALILFQSGARISEVLGLTIGDWREGSNFGVRAMAKSKGSMDLRVKEIWWVPGTNELLRRYVNSKRHDPKMRRLDELADSDYVFVTDEGKPLSYITYMSRWRQACKKAKIIFTPHQARHWYVTMALHKVEDYPPDQKEAFRQGLQAYMHWKSPTTIETYDHHIRIMDHHLIHEMIAKIASEGSTKEKVGSETSVPNPYALTKEHWEFINKRLLGKV